MGFVTTLYQGVHSWQSGQVCVNPSQNTVSKLIKIKNKIIKDANYIEVHLKYKNGILCDNNLVIFKCTLKVNIMICKW